MSRGRASLAKFRFATNSAVLALSSLGLTAALSLGISLGAAAGCAAPAVQVGPTTSPPPPRQVQVEYRPGYVWIDGRWTWKYDQWVWQPGYWVRDRPGYHYAPGRWENRDGRYVYVQGSWRRGDRPTSREFRRAVRHTGERARRE